MRNCVFLFLLAAATPVLATNQNVEISNAWVRAAPPTATMLAAYATLHNTSNQAVTLVKITSEKFGMVMLHESMIKNGLSKMRHVPRLVIEAGETVIFAPGGYHLMLMQAKKTATPPTPGKAQPITVGDKITFTFHFAKGDTVQTTATVKRDGY